MNRFSGSDYHIRKMERECQSGRSPETSPETFLTLIDGVIHRVDQVCKLPAEVLSPSPPPSSVGVRNGDLRWDFAVLDSWVHQDMRWCKNCAGEKLFVPVDRFPCGWRGYCLGCEEVVYVLDERTSEE